MTVERGNVVDGKSKLSQAVSLATYCPPPESCLTCSWLLGKTFGMCCLAECWLPTMKLSVINMSEICSYFPILRCPSYLIAPPKCLVNIFLYVFFSPWDYKSLCTLFWNRMSFKSTWNYVPRPWVFIFGPESTISYSLESKSCFTSALTGPAAQVPFPEIRKET